MLHINHKLIIAAIGFLILIPSALILLISCPYFAPPLSPACTAKNSNLIPDVFSYLTIIALIGLGMIVLGLVIPSKPIRDDYKSALGAP